jgi:hypothetical protein
MLSVGAVGSGGAASIPDRVWPTAAAPAAPEAAPVLAAAPATEILPLAGSTRESSARIVSAMLEAANAEAAATARAVDPPAAATDAGALLPATVFVSRFYADRQAFASDVVGTGVDTSSVLLDEFDRRALRTLVADRRQSLDLRNATVIYSSPSSRYGGNLSVSYEMRAEAATPPEATV